LPKKTRENNMGCQAIHRNYLPETYTENPTYFPVPVDLSIYPEEIMNFWMGRFVTEIRRKEGTEYPPNTFTNITAGLQRYLMRNVQGQL